MPRQRTNEGQGVLLDTGAGVDAAKLPEAVRAPRKTPLRMAVVKETDPLEEWHQEQVFRMAALNLYRYPELEWLHSVPNGGHRAKATAAAMQRQGQKSGVADIALDVARGGYTGLKIELKRFREGTPSTKQLEYLAFCRAHGCRALVCWGWRAAWEEITGYLELPPTETV